MNLLLCSDFTGVGYKYLKKFLSSGRGLNCLFVGYACEIDEEMFLGGANDRLLSFGFNLIYLTENYDFKDKIDAIYVRGGNTTKLIDYLKKYNQFEKIKRLVEAGALYIGNSAGSVLAGSDTAWTLDAEPYEEDLIKKYGKGALRGFGWVDKMVFVHTSKYRMCRSYEMEKGEDIFKTLDRENYPSYQSDRKKYDKSQYIKIGNNQALLVNGKTQKTITFDWRKIPVKIIEN